MTFVAAIPAVALGDHKIDRVEGEWTYGGSGDATLSVSRAGEDTFTAYLRESPLYECFRTGSELYEIRGHEPSYRGTEYLARTNEEGECTGGFTTTPANFTVTLEGRDQLVLTKFSSKGASRWTMQRVDTDGDALLDDEERSGVNADFDPDIEVDLEAMGADPERKDVFVEVDQMAGHPLSDAAVRRVAEAFRTAPVSNPGGSTGVSLHVDAGRSSLMNPYTGARWGELSESGRVPHAAVLGVEINDQYDWSEFDQLKREHFELYRGSVFHYALTAHRHPDPHTGGEARAIPSSDFMMAFARCPAGVDCNSPVDDQAAALMHELGHNLGLRHGGFESVNFKPNHFSIMNYLFAYGIPRAGTRRQYALDYSRFDFIDVPPLEETALDEGRGVAAAGAAGAYRTFHFCPGDAVDSRPEAIEANVPVDFDCSGAAAGSVSADVNADEELGPLATDPEWDALVYDGGAIGRAFGLWTLPGRTPPVEGPGQDATLEHVRGDFKPPKLRLRRARARGGTRKLIVISRDETALDRLVVRIGRKGKPVERKPKGGRRKVVFKRRVRKGKPIVAVALDFGGHATTKRVR